MVKKKPTKTELEQFEQFKQFQEAKKIEEEEKKLQEKIQKADEELRKIEEAKVPEVIPEPVTPLEEEVKKKDKRKLKKGLWYDIWKKKKLDKPNMVAVLFLRNNGMVETLEVESKRGLIEVNGKTYHERHDCIWTLNRKDRCPLAVIPEYNLVPMGTQIWVDKSMQEKFNELQDHVLRGIRHAELVRMGDKDPTKISTKKAIGIGIIIFIAAIVLMNAI